MTPNHRPACLLAALLASCHGYEPAPVDLDAHLRAFAERRVAEPPGGAALDRAAAREVAKTLHPDARLARLRAGVATVERDQSGRLDDPQFQAQVQNILEDVVHRWVPMAQIGFTLPINGRLGKERALADRRRDEALVAAWVTEQKVANDLDRAWVAWAAATRRAALFANTCEDLRALEQLADPLVDAGALSRPDARVFSLERLAREAALARAEAEARAAALEVHRRLGLHPDAQLALDPDADVAPFVADPAARRRALRRSPRLVQALRAHATAEAELDLQVRLQWPDLQLWPGWQEEDGQPRASFGFNLPLPILTGNDPAIARARAERELTAAAVGAALEQLLQELAVAETRAAGAAAEAEQVEAIVALARRQLEDASALADAGQFDPLLTLDALLRLHDVQLRAIDAAEAASLATVTINDLLTDPRSDEPGPEGDDR